jgi:hypothetical protein
MPTPRHTERSTNGVQGDGARHLELFVQSFAPVGHQATDEIIDGVTELVDAGYLDDFSVYLWGKRISPDAPATEQTDQGQFFTTRLDQFYRWATTANRDLEPMFERTEVDSSFADRSYDVISVPTVALAEYQGRTLEHVTPHRASGRYVAVDDRLADLETRVRDSSDQSPTTTESAAVHAPPTMEDG